MFEYLTNIKCRGLRYPKVFQYKDKQYLFGSKQYEHQNDITNYGLYIMELSDNFQIINDMGFIEFDEYPYLNNITKSAWLRDIQVKNDMLYLNVEIKQNVDNKRFYHKNILLSTCNLRDFIIIKEYNVTDFIFKETCYKNDHYLFTSKIGKDIDNPDFFWGIYLLNIIKNDLQIQPQFDAIVDYTKDKGHLIHNIEYDELCDEHTIYFTIRHMVDKLIDKSGFVYKVYKAQSKDLINYYNTQEIRFSGFNTMSKWFSYPHYFEYNGYQFIICNQDDYGKHLEPVIFKCVETHESLVVKLYPNLKLSLHNNLRFTSDKKYIYYNELVNKNGSRYDYIQNNNLNINEYSSYAPSCNQLLEVMKKMNISADDSIIDIGCGRGFALSLFSLFPFKKISGIEISVEDIQICKHNLHDILKLHNTEIITGDILNFNDYKLYNMFYMYNPFSADIFNVVVSNINVGSFIICKNIHEKEMDILKQHNYSLVFEHIGEERNYVIFKKIE